MLNFQLATDKDRREAASIEKRRAFEEERRKRIFNPRARLIGVDLNALQQQIEEKRLRDAENKKVDEIFEETLLKADHVALALAEKERQERQRLQQEINNYRRNYQRPEDRREFDLNDPNLIKKQLPARIDDNDPRLGPSAAQKFEGEDMLSDQRSILQREQIKSWLEQQMREKEEADKERKAAEEAYKAAVMARDERALQLDAMEKDCRKRLQEACLRFNKALAAERECEKQKQEKQTQEDNLAEMYNALTSDMLTENKELSQSSLGMGRIIGSLYKGMTDAEKEQIRKEQRAQIEEAKKRKELEARINREFDEYSNGTQKTVYLLDQNLQRQKRERNKKLAEENKRLAEEQRSQKEYLKNIVYSNTATADYFDQFNKSTR